MGLVAVGLFVVVLYLANKAPGPTATSLPPMSNVPTTGASGVPSPAKTGGNPQINSQNGVIAQVSSQYVGTYPKAFTTTSPGTYWGRRQRSVVGGNYMTDAQSSLRTQDVPPIVQTVPNGTVTGQKL